MTVGVYLRNYLRTLLNKGYSSFEPELIQHWLGLMFQAMVSNTVEFQVKKHICLAFETLLQVYSTVESTHDKIKDFYGNLFESVHT